MEIPLYDKKLKHNVDIEQYLEFEKRASATSYIMTNVLSASIIIIIIIIIASYIYNLPSVAISQRTIP